MIAVKCPTDGTLHYANDDLVGRTIRCRTCGATLTIGSQDQIAAEENKPGRTDQEIHRIETGEAQPETEATAELTKRTAPWGYVLGVAGLVACVVFLIFGYLQSRTSPVSTQIDTGNINRSASEHSPESPSGDQTLSAVKHPPRAKQPETNLSGVESAYNPPPPCAEGREPSRLPTGARIEPDGEMSGQSNIRIMNASAHDVVVRLADSVTGKTSRFVYIQAGESFVMQGIKAGAYKVRFQFGRDWIPNCHEFVRDCVFGEFRDPLVFLDDRIRFYTVTLSSSISGSTRTRRIDRRTFLEGDQSLLNSQ